jgi:hypothetical protein
MQIIDVFFHRYMFTLIAAVGTAAEWLLACWLFPDLADLSFGAHAWFLAAMLSANRIAASVLRQDPPRQRALVLPARITTAAAFCSLAGVAVLLGLAVLSTALDVVGAPSAEASMLVERPFLPWPAEVPLTLPLVALAMGSVAYGYAHGHKRRVVVEHTVPVSGLPPALEGLRIVHLSDLHVGPIADMRCIRDAIDRVLALDPDIVCVTGDIVDSPSADLSRWMPELARLEARRGVFAILGNHDKVTGATRVANTLRSTTSWSVLRDETATLVVDGARLHIVGLEDRTKAESVRELPRLLLSLPAGEPVILLAHRPVVFTTAVSAEIALTLAGHTHGGQIALPGAPRLNVARIVMTRFDAGLFTAGRSTLHVSRGLGTSGQPVRIGVPREIAVLTLVGRARVAAAS